MTAPRTINPRAIAPRTITSNRRRRTAWVLAVIVGLGLCVPALTPVSFAQSARVEDDTDLDAALEDLGRRLREAHENFEEQMRAQSIEIKKMLADLKARSRRQREHQSARSQRRIDGLEKEVTDLRALVSELRAALADVEPESREPIVDTEPMVPRDREVEVSAAFVGFGFQPGDGGLEVTGVIPGTPAQAIGMEVGDTITQIDGQPASPDVLREVMLDKKPGDPIVLAWQRGSGKELLSLQARTRVANRDDFVEAVARFMATGTEAAAAEAAAAEAAAAEGAGTETRDEPTVTAQPSEPRRVEPRTADRVVLGVHLRPSEDFVLTVSSVTPGSNAAEAGLQEGDVLLRLDGRRVRTREGVIDVLGLLSPGDETTITYRRDGTEYLARMVLALQGSPPKLLSLRGNSTLRRPGMLGVQVQPGDPGVEVLFVQPDSAATRMGLRSGDVLLAANERDLNDVDTLREIIADVGAGGVLHLRVRRGDQELRLDGKLDRADATFLQPSSEESEPPPPAPPGSAARGDPAAIDRVAFREQEPPRPWLGLELEHHPGFFLVTEVALDSPAARGGLRVGDEIVRVAGTLPGDLDAVRALLDARAPGDALPFEVERDGERVSVAVTVGPRP